MWGFERVPSLKKEIGERDKKLRILNIVHRWNELLWIFFFFFKWKISNIRAYKNFYFHFDFRSIFFNKLKDSNFVSEPIITVDQLDVEIFFSFSTWSLCYLCVYANWNKMRRILIFSIVVLLSCSATFSLEFE